MPDPYWPKHKHSFRLSDAENIGAIGYRRCRYCKASHHYLLSDLKQLFGDIECDDVTDKNVWRCGNCRKTYTVVMTLAYPSAAERATMTIRRLKEIRYVKRVIWEDVEG